VFHLSPGRDVKLGRDGRGLVVSLRPVHELPACGDPFRGRGLVLADAGSRNGVAVAARGDVPVRKDSRILVGDKMLRGGDDVKTCLCCGKEYPDTVKFCRWTGSTLRSKNPTANLVGQVIADRYSIIKKLGEGGMGAVYLGEHVKMARKSAIKVMNPSMANDPDAISRFNREASNASRISHPNVCQIYDFGETPDWHHLSRHGVHRGCRPDGRHPRRRGAPWTPVRAARILKQSADALAAAHDLAIVHRDIKPRQHHDRPGPGRLGHREGGGLRHREGGGGRRERPEGDQDGTGGGHAGVHEPRAAFPGDKLDGR